MFRLIFFCILIGISVGLQLNSNSTLLSRTKRKPAFNQGANFNFNMNLDLVNAMKLYQDNNANSQSYEGFVRGMLETVHNEVTAGTGYGIMVYNLNQDYENKLQDVASYKSIVHKDRTYGVWVFRCGGFKNKGSRGWENWGFKHVCMWRYSNGDGVNFEHDDCSNSDWRETNRC